jgi:hypothetical protein
MKFFLGRSRETRSHISEAMRLSPRDPLLFHWHFFIGVADLNLGRMGRALESLRKSVEINPNSALSQFVLIGALALKGLPAEAAEVCAAALASPNFTIAKFRAEAVSDNRSTSRSANASSKGCASPEHLRDEPDQLLFAYRAHGHRGQACCRHRREHAGRRRTSRHPTSRRIELSWRDSAFESPPYAKSPQGPEGADDGHEL